MKPPAFQFYPSDFLSDLNVIVMSGAEVGAYALLMSVCWIENGLPDDLEELATVSKMDVTTFTSSWERRLRRCFIKRDDGRWDHPRLQAERDKQQRFRERMSEAGARGGRGHKATGKGSAKGRLSGEKGKAFENKALQSLSVSNNNPLPPSGDVDAVLEHYGQLHKNRKVVGKKLRTIVSKALEHFCVAELVQALDGNARDPWHRERGKHELGYVLRDPDMINSFREKLLRPIPQSAAKPALVIAPSIRARAERLYTELPRHGFTQNRPIDQHLAKAKELAERNVITDLPQFTRELEALLPLTWLGTAREFDREKSIARIAAAIAPIQPERAA